MGGHIRYRARDLNVHRRRHLAVRNPAIVTKTIFFDPARTERITGFSTLPPAEEENTATQVEEDTATSVEEEQPRTTQEVVDELTSTRTSTKAKATTTSASDREEITSGKWLVCAQTAR